MKFTDALKFIIARTRTRRKTTAWCLMDGTPLGAHNRDLFFRRINDAQAQRSLGNCEHRTKTMQTISGRRLFFFFFFLSWLLSLKRRIRLLHDDTMMKRSV